MRRTPNRAWGTPNWNTITKNSITSCTTERTDTNVTYLLGKTPPILKGGTFLNVATCEWRPSSFFPEDANSPKCPVKYYMHTPQGYTKQIEERIRAFQKSGQTSIKYGQDWFFQLQDPSPCRGDAGVPVVVCSYIILLMMPMASVIFREKL